MANTIVHGRCEELSIQETTKKNPFIWSSWRTEKDELRYWIGYLVTTNRDDKSIRRTASFLREIGWDRPLTGKPMTHEEVNALSEYLAKHKPEGLWPMIAGQTFLVHAEVAKKVADQHGRIPIWQQIGSYIQELENAAEMTKSASPVQPEPQATAPASVAHTVSAPSEEAVATLPSPEPAKPTVAPKGGKMRVENVEPGPVLVPSAVNSATPPGVVQEVPMGEYSPEAMEGLTVNKKSQPIAPKQASKVAQVEVPAKAQPKQPAQPATTKEAAVEQQKQVPPKQNSIQELQELRSLLVASEKDINSLLDANDILRRKLNESERYAATAGTKFCQKVVELWAATFVPADTPKDELSTRLIEDANKAIEAKDALRLVLAMREMMTSLPRARDLHQNRTSADEGYEID